MTTTSNLVTKQSKSITQINRLEKQTNQDLVI